MNDNVLVLDTASDVVQNTVTTKWGDPLLKGIQVLPLEVPKARDNPILKKKVAPFPEPLTDVEIPETNERISFSDAASYLVTMMMKHGGVGLAANQLGLNWRMFAFVDTYTDRQKPINRVAINPKIVGTDGKTVMIREGCLSYPNVMFNIKRREVVTLNFYDVVIGQKITQTFGGMTARIIFHEYDHLEGKVMADRV
jgi:peptide deformylase